jgi:transmembrane sensor
MSERETSRDIDEQAADWVARRDRSPLSAVQAQELDAWLSSDRRHRGALLRADALAMLSESAQALGSDFEPSRFFPSQGPVRSHPSRRKLLAWAGGGGLAAASLVALGLGAPAFGAIATRRGEVRRVTLDDGSTVMLNTETGVRVWYSGAERRVQLLYGEVYFTIVGDPRSPFLVDVGEARLSAEPGAVRIRSLDGGPLDVLVDKGKVLLRAARGTAPIVIGANMRMTLPSVGIKPGGQPMMVTPDIVSRELAWRDGKVAFEGERLDQAAAEFARYSRMRIDIADPALAAEPVSGLFSAADPVGFAHAVAGIFDAEVAVRGNVVTLARPKVVLGK